MQASEFKNRIKEVKELLVGKTLKLSTKNSSTPYKTLREFGNAVLEQESFGQSFSMPMVYTTEGLIGVRNFKQLVKLLKKPEASGIYVRSYKAITCEADYIRSFGSLD